MKPLLILAVCAAPLVLAGCEPVGVQGQTTVIGADPAAQATVIPNATPGGATVVVQPTRTVSTNLAELAGHYDTDPLACRHATSPTRVTITDSGMVMEGRQYRLDNLSRTGSALKLDLSTTQGSTVTSRIVYVTPAAPGIVLRASTAGDQNLIRCES